MAEYAIYKYLFDKDTSGEKPLIPLTSESCQSMMDELLTSSKYVGRDHVYVIDFCKDRRLKVMEGHSKEYVESHPGRYVIIDNREGVFQLAIECNSSLGTDPDKMVSVLFKTLKEGLSQYGQTIKFYRKFLAKSFKNIAYERIRKGDSVKRIVFNFPNPNRVVGVDATKYNMAFLANIARLTKAHKGKLTLLGNDGSELTIDDESTEELNTCIALCAQNGYSLAYHFNKSGVLRFDKKVYALDKIENVYVEDFIKDIKALDFDGENVAYDLISVLDRIRYDISDTRWDETLLA